MNPLHGPLRGLLFAAGGIALAWLWFHSWPILPVVIVAALFLAADLTARRGMALLYGREPVRALRLLELRGGAVSVLTAAAGAAVIIVGVAWTAPSGADPTTKQLVTSASSAVVAFITAVTIKSSDIDAAVGGYVEARFKQVYVLAGKATGRQVALPLGSDGLKAVESSREWGWTDWSGAYRAKRARKLKEYLDAHP